VEKTDFVRGGSFLIQNISPEQSFTPEDLNEEQKMIAKLTEDFAVGEVVPHRERIENLDIELTVQLLRKAGELGLLGAEIPEKYGGMGLDKISATLITEHIVPAGSFALSHGAHVGIGSLPIVLFGNEDQKKRYLPDLASGKKLAAYALTEPGSGSDALGAKTKAVLSEDGKYYILNGTKQWITNSGFADVFVVYAKVDGEKFTAFIVDRDTPGLSTGPEEKKMGIKGSSTRALILEDVKVPVENLLGEIGKGHVIAFNILNIGRYKLGAGCAGMSKQAIQIAATYANGRYQFGKPISSFGLIKKKLADMNIRAFIAESIVYRTAGLIDAHLRDLDEDAVDYGRQVGKRIEEYALECSINKIYGSEALDFIVDEGVQIHGGYGYMQEYEIENLYRGSRINRIFEGTNEINRLLILATLMRKTMKGELPLLQVFQGLEAELRDYKAPVFPGPLGEEKAAVESAKKLFLMVTGSAVQKYMQQLEEKQEIIGNLADIAIEVFAMESGLLRAEKTLARAGEARAQNQVDMIRVYTRETLPRLEVLAREVLNAVYEGEKLQHTHQLARKMTTISSLDTIGLKRQVAERVIAASKYVS
jgi:alkylation response protein AidB-like acyl-CoA dehydrogenase